MNGYLMFDDYNSQKILIVSINRSLNYFNFAYNPDVKRFPFKYESKLKADLKKHDWFEDMKATMIHEIEYPKE